MLKVAAAEPRITALLWRYLSVVLRFRPVVAPSESERRPTIDSLSAARLRDLGFERDQVGSSIDFAKGEHQRFF
jgi:hypothetical protein